MGIRPTNLRKYIIRPVLQELDAWSGEAEDLLLGTAAVESNLGEYLKQIDGPALGIYQMEPRTHDDIWRNFILHREELCDRVLQFGPARADDMVGNLYYATAMARVHYLRVPENIPFSVQGQAEYWKEHYNTELGKGTVLKYIRAYPLAQ